MLVEKTVIVELGESRPCSSLPEKAKYFVFILHTNHTNSPPSPLNLAKMCICNAVLERITFLSILLSVLKLPSRSVMLMVGAMHPLNTDCPSNHTQIMVQV